MATESLATALEREHREIDEGIDTFAAGNGREREPLTRVIAALRRHIYLEEEFVFPPLREAGLVAPILVMLREHAQMWEALESLEREIDDGADGLRLALHQLSVQLQHHNLKEERIVYPQADDVLTASDAARLRAFLGAGELPEGWVCTKLQR